MSVKDIAKLGKLLAQFLAGFVWDEQTKTALTTSRCLFQPPDSIACWMLSCTFPKSGQMIRSAEKNYIPDEIEFQTNLKLLWIWWIEPKATGSK